MSKKKATAICLPMSRTARIMNSAIGVDCVDQDMIALATKATEIFIQDLTRKAYEFSDDDSNAINYDDVQRMIHDEPQYDFLEEWIPKRIKLRDALRMHEGAQKIEQVRLQQRQQTQANHLESLQDQQNIQETNGIEKTDYNDGHATKLELEANSAPQDSANDENSN